MFKDCNSLVTLNLSNFDTSKVTTMYQMFYRCENLISLDLSNFDTSKVTNMFNMFEYCSSLKSITAKQTVQYKILDRRSYTYLSSSINWIIK